MKFRLSSLGGASILFMMTTFFTGCQKRTAEEPTSTIVQPSEATPTTQDPILVSSAGDDSAVRLIAGSGDFASLPGLPEPSPLQPPEPEGEVVLAMTFDAAPEGINAVFDTFAYEDFKAETRSLGDSEVGTPNPAAFIGGAEGETHEWKPSLSWRFAPQSEGFLRITMDIYQASYETASLDFQLVDQRNGFDVHYTLQVLNDFIRLPFTQSRWFEDTLSAGSGAQWHRLSWIVPLPGQTIGPMELSLNGERIGDIRHNQRVEGAITGLRLYIFRNRNPEVAFYIDNLLIEHFDEFPYSNEPQPKMSFF